jgi:hypothetical protein
MPEYEMPEYEMPDFEEVSDQ